MLKNDVLNGWLVRLLWCALPFLMLSCVEEPEGTVTLKLRNSSNGGGSIWIADNAYVKIDQANNFYGAEFVCVGKKPLARINTVPESGWAGMVAVEPGKSYVARGCVMEWDDDCSCWMCKGDYNYLRIKVVDWIESASSGGIIGAEVQYAPLE